MARIDDVLLTGTFGNVVLYRRMGTPCARIKRTHIKQTVATQRRGVNFGIAARAGKALRSGLAPAMPNQTDRSMQSRFSGAIAKWLGQSEVTALQPADYLPYVSSFSFTEDAGFTSRFKVPFTVIVGTSEVSVNLGAFTPAMNISAPAGTLSVRLIISVSSAVLATGTAAGQASLAIDIAYDDVAIPPQALSFEVAATAGNVIVTAARLVYSGSKNNYPTVMEKKGFNPAGVINAAYC